MIEEEEEFEDNCTKDNITLADYGSLKVDFNTMRDEEAYEFKKIESLFKISNEKCSFTKFHVSMNDGPYDPIPEDYSVFINSDNSLVINNFNGAPDLSFYVICTSNQGFTLTKKVSVSFKNLDQDEKEVLETADNLPGAKDNKPPEFASKLNTITIDLTFNSLTDQILETLVNGQRDTDQISLPKIIDLEDDSISLKVKKICNGCLELVKVSKTEYVV